MEGGNSSAASLTAEMLDDAPFGFLSFADDGTIRVVNATALSLLGYEREAVLGRGVETILSLAGRIFYQTHFFPLVSLHGEANEVYLILRSREGQNLGVLLNAARRERDGATTYDCAFMQVREREKFEAELLRAKKAAEEAQASLEIRSAQLEEANSHLESQAVELELQQKALEEQAVQLEMQSDALQESNAELRQRSEAVEKQRALAEEANRAKSTFLTTMSHELRTPLNAIGGYTELLEMEIHGPVTTAQREALSRIQKSQRHLLRLINDVLNLARIEAGRVDYTIEEIAASELVAAVLPMVEPQFAAKRITLKVDVDPAAVVTADLEKAQQVLLNLLGNAAKFTPEGGTVGIATEDGDEVGEWISVSVSDTGPGIPDGMLSSIFEPFVQVDSSHTRKGQGSGLGLAISRDLARGMGGELTARSVEGEGSVFTLALPRLAR